MVNDSLKLNCTSIEVLDADGDGDTDVFVSGANDSDSLMSGFLINKGNFYFTPKHTIELAGNTSIGDFNGDGFFDIILMAEDLAGQWHTKKYQSGIEWLHHSRYITSIKKWKSFCC